MKPNLDLPRIAAILLTLVLSGHSTTAGQASSESVRDTATIAGDWQITLPGSERTWPLEIEQDVDDISGQVNLPDGLFDILDGRIHGTEFRFHILDACGNPRDVSGQLVDERLEGRLHSVDGPPLNWSAVRTEN